MSKRLVLTTILAGAAVAATASPVAAADGPARPADAELQLTPVAGIPGSTVSVTGTGCLFDGQPGMGKAVIGGGVIPIDPTPAGPDGTWKASAKVPAGVVAGRYEVTGACGNAQGSWSYSPVHYFVTDHTTPRVTVSSDQVHPGERLAVRGAGCTGPGSKVNVLNGLSGIGQLDVVTAEPDLDGSWGARLDVPGDAGPGTAPIGAHCVGPDGAIRVFYIPAIVEVTPYDKPAPPTTETAKRTTTRPGAVKAKPRYTG